MGISKLLKEYYCVRNFALTLLTLGGFLPKPTIKMQSAWRTHRWVHSVNVLSHWYKVILNWSSCWANHDINLYSLFASIIEGPKFLRIMSEVNRRGDAKNDTTIEIPLFEVFDYREEKLRKFFTYSRQRVIQFIRERGQRNIVRNRYNSDCREVTLHIAHFNTTIKGWFFPRTCDSFHSY